MALSRRAFATGALASAGVAAAGLSRTRPLRLLVLGGTHYLGPAIVEAALEAGHRVTLFNRGKTNPGLFPSIESIKGDRAAATEDLRGLAGRRRWDAAIDVWPADAAMSERSARLLEGRVDRYVYVSSISAYAPLMQPGADERAPLVTSAEDPADYGLQKAETERRLLSIYGPLFSSVRPTAILGWRDDSDALTFWAVRMQRGGDVLAPGDGSDPVQLIDVKDVGDFVVRIVEAGLEGSYNLVGPAREMRFAEFLGRILQATGGQANPVWIDDQFLLDQGFRDYSNFPLYRPLRRARHPGFNRISATRAIAAGLRFRPLEATTADALRWFALYRPAGFEFGGVGQPADTPWWERMGIPRARELALIEAWRRRQA